MLLESVAYDTNKLITVNRNGMIMSINASWSDLIINELIFSPIQEQQLPKEYARIITAKTDAILIEKFWIDNSDFLVERRFKKIDGKWFLIYYNDVNL